MQEDKINNQNLHQCNECGLHYKDKDTAEKCEAWCKEHKTCNVEITSRAEENLVSNSIELDTNEKSKEDKEDVDQVEELKKKNEECLNNWKRAEADFANYKKDEIERMGVLVKYTKEDMILKVLSILDSIYLLKQHTDKLEFVSLSEGIMQIEKQIHEFLRKEGIEEIKTEGQKFNPETMEAIGEAEGTDEGSTEGGDEGTIVEELQKGYIMNGRVLRPARVKTTK